MIACAPPLPSADRRLYHRLLAALFALFALTCRPGLTCAAEPVTPQAHDLRDASSAPAVQAPPPPSPSRAYAGVVIDAQTHAPLADVRVESSSRQERTDAQGHFDIEVDERDSYLYVLARGHRRQLVDLPSQPSPQLRVELTPLRARALYLSAYGIANSKLRNAALALAARTSINALVIDVKGDASLAPYSSPAMRAAGITQPWIGVKDMPELLQQLHAQGLYLIARIVVFKDTRLAAAHHEWGVHAPGGALWRDREKLAWIDPSVPAAWDLSLSMAQEAASMGFDEIQFDYLRFPDASGLQFSVDNTVAHRRAAIEGYLHAARRRLAPDHVFVSADIFGYVCWNADDTHIGQQLEGVLPLVDYVSPMLYPSGFTWGIPDTRNPVLHPDVIVRESLEEAMARTHTSGDSWRPWLQAFRDYAFDHRPFGAREIRAQIEAAQASHSDGWMLWNARNQYSDAGLTPAPPAAAPPAIPAAGSASASSGPKSEPAPDAPASSTARP